MSMTWSEACAIRVQRHGLAEPVPAGRLADQVGVMCGVHAQVMSAAELSIGLRVDGITRLDVRHALWTERSLVKTHGPRGTVHLLATADLPTWCGALSSALELPNFSPDIRLSAEQMDEVVAAIGEALADRELTTDELGEEVVARTGSWAGDLVMPAFQQLWPRWRQAIQTAACRGALCFGPNRGQKVTFTSPRRWLPGFEPAAREASMATVLARYLYAYGPATPQQFARWLGVSAMWAGRFFEALGDRARRVTLDGAEAWVVDGGLTPDERAPSADASRGVRLLPYFDAYGVGCHPRERVFPGRAGERAMTGGQAGNVPIVLVDGVVHGVWHSRRSGARLAITVELFEPADGRRRRQIDEQVERIGQVMEAKAEWQFGEVTVGPHA